MPTLPLGLLAVGILVASCREQAPESHPPRTAPVRHHGYVLQPAAGEPLTFCTAPELTVNIKVSPVTTGDSPIVMGTAELAMGSNFGTHPDEDEIIYFVAGKGQVVVSDTTFPIAPGTTAYIPRGVRHGFVSEGDVPIRFVWAISPPGLEERFRADGHPPGYDCSQEAATR